MKKSKTPFIQLPNKLVRDPNITAIDFVLLFKLKHLAFLHNSCQFEVDNNKLKLALGIADNKTIKKSYKNLYEQDYLLEPAELLRGKPVKFTINEAKLSSKEEYTQLPIYVIEHLDTIKYVGFRLLYYYSSYINKSKLYAYPSIETIKQHLGVHKDTVQEYNEKLRKAKLISIEKHDLRHDYTYDINDRLERTKYNNHYILHIDKLVAPKHKMC